MQPEMLSGIITQQYIVQCTWYPRTVIHNECLCPEIVPTRAAHVKHLIFGEYVSEYVPINQNMFPDTIAQHVAVNRYILEYVSEYVPIN